MVGRLDLHGAPHLVARHEPQGHGVDEPEQAVSAADEPKQLGIFRPAARTPRPVRTDKRQRLHVGHERAQR